MNIPKTGSALTPKSDLPWSSKDALIRLVVYYGLILIFLLTFQLGISNIVYSINHSINQLIIEAAINGIIGLVLSYIFLSFDGKKLSIVGFKFHRKFIFLLIIALIATSIALTVAYIVEITGGVVLLDQILTERYKIENLANINDFLNYLAIFFITFFGIALGEEIMFRGYILNVLDGQIGFSKAAIISSILFGFLHSFLWLSGSTDVINSMIAIGISATIFGFVFAYAFKITGNNLVLPILIHGVWDSIIYFFNTNFIYKTIENVIFEITSQLCAALVLIFLLFVFSKIFVLTTTK